MKKDLIHVPVMLEQTIDFLNIKPDGIYVDCTLGRAGHSKAILEHLVNGKLYAFDLDQSAIDESKILLKDFDSKYELIKSSFINLEKELLKRNVTKVDGILYDLGVSSPQLDEESRGFSYKSNAKLDMRMNQSQKLTAWDIVNSYSYEDLKYIIKVYGEEKFASKIAKNIVDWRTKKPIDTTQELVSIIKKSLPMKQLNKAHHPAKKTFQAIRIAVNDELNSLKISLTQALNLLKPKARIVVISFHSLEDRIVKNIFVQATQDPQQDVYAKLPYKSDWIKNYQLITKKPIIPSAQEIMNNPRARSAKLRIIQKIN